MALFLSVFHNLLMTNRELDDAKNR